MASVKRNTRQTAQTFSRLSTRKEIKQIPSSNNSCLPSYTRLYDVVMSRDMIPPVLAPYIRGSDDRGPSLSLVTSTLTTPAHWLVVRHLYAGLAPLTLEGTSSAHPVVFVSLLHSKDLWLELCKKVGLDLASLTRSDQLIYIDGVESTNLIPLRNDSNFSVSRLHSLDLDGLLQTVETALSRATRTTLIIDGIDFLLASQPTTTALRLQQGLTTLCNFATHTTITLHADTPLLHNHSSPASTPLEKDHASLLTTLAHQARYIFQLRGLSTGAAKGITGVLRVTRGGGFDDDSEEGGGAEGLDGEWLYQSKGDGSVNLWVRGE
jgi:elongator complex protein 6